MGAETGSRSSLEQEVSEFIDDNYPVNNAGVKRMYDELKSFASVQPRFDVIDREMAALQEIASREGIRDIKRVGPGRHLPTRLAALKKFEDKYRHKTVRQLDPSNYVRLLAIAEITTAKRGQGRDAALHEKGFLASHTQNAIILMGFYKKLNK